MRARRITGKTAFSALALALLLAVLGGLVVEANRQSPDIVLTGSTDKSVYQSGERIIITFGLSNVGDETLLVSPVANANMRVESFTRDGLPVAETLTTPLFSEEFGYSLQTSLTPLSPGEKAQLLWVSGLPSETRDAELAIVEYDGTEFPVMRRYSISRPGEYTLAVRYEYAGLQETVSGVFIESTGTIELRFEVGE